MEEKNWAKTADGKNFYLKSTGEQLTEADFQKLLDANEGELCGVTCGAAAPNPTWTIHAHYELATNMGKYADAIGMTSEYRNRIRLFTNEYTGAINAICEYQTNHGNAPIIIAEQLAKETYEDFRARVLKLAWQEHANIITNHKFVTTDIIQRLLNMLRYCKHELERIPLLSPEDAPDILGRLDIVKLRVREHDAKCLLDVLEEKLQSAQYLTISVKPRRDNKYGRTERYDLNQLQAHLPIATASATNATLDSALRNILDVYPGLKNLPQYPDDISELNIDGTLEQTPTRFTCRETGPARDTGSRLREFDNESRKTQRIRKLFPERFAAIRDVNQAFKPKLDALKPELRLHYNWNCEVRNVAAADAALNANKTHMLLFWFIKDNRESLQALVDQNLHIHETSSEYLATLDARLAKTPAIRLRVESLCKNDISLRDVYSRTIRETLPAYVLQKLSIAYRGTQFDVDLNTLEKLL